MEDKYFRKFFLYIFERNVCLFILENTRKKVYSNIDFNNFKEI